MAVLAFKLSLHSFVRRFLEVKVVWTALIRFFKQRKKISVLYLFFNISIQCVHTRVTVCLFLEAELNFCVLTEISELDVSQHVEAALLDVVDEGDEAHTAARVGNHQQDLRPPELDVVLPHIQHQQVLTHLLEAR